jgi:uncharacterized membrane protein YtjA (UPF0391 family)
MQGQALSKLACVHDESFYYIAKIRKDMDMLHYTVVFFVIAIIAAVFGFGGIAAGATEIAKILFFVFLAITIISFLVGKSR